MQVLKLNNEKSEYAMSQKIGQVEKEKQALIAELRQAEAEKSGLKETIIKLENRIRELTSALQQRKEEHLCEIEKVKNENMLMVANMKALHSSVRYSIVKFVIIGLGESSS